MNYDELLKRLEDEELESKSSDRLHYLLRQIHAAVAADYEVYGKAGVCVFIKSKKNAVILSIHRRIEDSAQLYHQSMGGWREGTNETLIRLACSLLAGNYSDGDLIWTVDESGSPAGFYKTDGHDIYYGETPLAAAEAYAKDCDIPLHQAFRDLRSTASLFNGRKLVAPDGMRASYMGTAVLAYRKAAMAARTKPWENEW